MKLYVLDLGKIVMEGENPVVGHGGAGEKPAIPIHAFLLQTGATNILFDTGCHPRAIDGAWPEALRGNPFVPGDGGALLTRLAQLGLRPEDIDHVIVSHLHLDHAGGVHLFPQAQVFVQQEELEHVLADDAAGTLDFFHVQCDVDNWKRAGTRWVPVPRDVRETPLCPGVTILNLGPGHSFGMLGLSVSLQCGSFVMAADAIYAAEHLGPPAKLSGAVYDEAGYFAAIDYLSGYAAAHGATLLFGHDMAQFQTLKRSTEGYYT